MAGTVSEASGPMQSSSRRLEVLCDIWEQRFQLMMDYVCTAHPYYQRVLAQEGLSRSDFRRLADLRKLPITTKLQYMMEPEAFRLQTERLPGLTLPERTLWGAVYTTGSTTGSPTPFYDTSYDNVARIAQMREAAEMAGVGAADVVANCFPLTAVPHQGFLSALYGPLAVGAKVLTGFTGPSVTPFPVYRSTEEFARLVEQHRATVLWGITSYIRHFVRVAESLQMDFSSVRLAFVAGEPCPAGMRADLRRRLTELGAPGTVIQNGYGCTEMQGPAIECAEGGALHVPAAEQYWFEVVDAATHEPLREGDSGLVLLSHLNRRGTVLLRYAIGDISAIAMGRCPSCGREGPRFVESPRRGDDLVKIRGTLLNPAVVVEAISSLAGVDDFQLVATLLQPDDPLSAEELVIRFTAKVENAGDLTLAIAEKVRDVCEISPRVVYLPHEEFAHLEDAYKFKRFHDTRQTNNR
jgi:phenylacetate-CoA ligase